MRLYSSRRQTWQRSKVTSAGRGSSFRSVTQRTVKGIVATLTVLALSATGLFGATAANAAAPKVSFTAESSNATVLTGGRIGYNFRIECSNIDPENCTGVTLSFPAPVIGDSGLSATDPQVSADQVDIVESSSFVDGVFEVVFKEMAPGDSTTFQVSWAVPNFVIEEGEVIQAEPVLTAGETPGEVEVAQIGAGPAPITTLTQPAIQVSKQLISPLTAPVQPGADVVNNTALYRLTVCVPGNSEGMENLSQVVLTDVLSAVTPVNGGPSTPRDVTLSDVTIEQQTLAGDIVAAPANVTLPNGATGVQMSWTINLDGETLTRCGTGNEPIVRDVTVTYGDSMKPVATEGDGTPRIEVTNTANGSATTISGKTASGAGSTSHTFYGLPTSEGTTRIIWQGKDVRRAGGDAVYAGIDTSSQWGWGIHAAWSSNGDSSQRWLSLMDRIPCVAADGSQATSPLTAAGSHSYEDTWSGSAPYSFDANGDMIAWGVPDNACTTPAFQTNSINFRATAVVNLAAIQYAYVDADGVSHAGVFNIAPGEIDPDTSEFWGTRGTWIDVYADAPTGDYLNLGLPAGAIITDVASVFRNAVSSDWGDHATILWGNSTQAFADAARDNGLLLQTNYTQTIASEGSQSGPDQLPTVGTNVTAGWGTNAMDYAAMTFVPAVVNLGISKSAADAAALARLKLGDVIDWNVTVNYGTSTPVADILPVVSDVLPAGLTYVEGSASWSGLPDGIEAPTDPVISEVDGKTKLTWAFEPGNELVNNTNVVLSFQTQVSLDAAVGSHSGSDAQYVAVADQNNAVPNGGNQPDTYDVDEDGDTTERVPASQVTWTVVAQSGATIEKFVHGSVGSDEGVDQPVGSEEWTKAGVSAASIDNSGTFVDYRLNVRNSGTRVLTDTVVYDVLPYVGDTAIGAALQGEARESEFQVNFRELLGSLPTGVSVEFSTSNNPPRPELFDEIGVTQEGVSGTWTSVLPADPSTVRALKFTIDTLPAGTELNLDYRADIPVYEFGVPHPAEQTGADTEYAWNNLAFQTNDGNRRLLPAEAPKVSIRSVLGRIGDFAWYDVNRDGIQQDTERPVAGVVFQLLDGDGEPVLDVDGNPITATTDENGEYFFDVPVGDWSVRVTSVPEGYSFTDANAGGDDALDSDVPGLNVPSEPVSITADALENLALDAGLVGAVSVGDYVWLDTNQDGIQQDDEPGIGGVELTLYGPDGEIALDANGDPIPPQTTLDDGSYLFDELPVLTSGQSYTVKVTGPPAGYVPTKANEGDDTSVDSSTGEASSTGLTSPGQSDTTLDFGFLPLGEIGDYVWFDANGDGIQQDDETPVEGVVFELLDEDGNPVLDEDGNPVRTTTDEKGWYSFTVPIGTWSVQIVSIPDGYGFTKPNQGGDDALDSDALGLNIPFASVTLTPDNLVNHTLDAGLVATVSVGDFVWFDTDADGVQDAGEPGIADIWLTLYGPDGQPATDVWGNPVAPVKTDANGYYLFENLPVLEDGHSYTVRIDRERTLEENPSFGSFLPTTPNATTRDADSSTWEASTEGLTGAGDSDLTLDFGFVRTVPAIDIEKFDVDGNDADTAEESVALPDGSTTLNFQVTNLGSEDLVDITVSDEVLQGTGTVTGLVCTFPDSSTGTSWAGPFAPGAQFDCVADLDGVTAGTTHLDTASVDATARYTGTPVSDEDDYNAHTPNPSIDIEKLDVDGNDADTVADTVRTSSASKELVFVVTNTGDEALRDITLTDLVTAGSATVEGLSCTFPDGSTGITWAGPLEPGESFECTATVTGLVVGSQHTDLAGVQGTGVESGKTVTDEDPYNVIRVAGLPVTGGQLSMIGVALAATMLLAGLSLIVIRRARARRLGEL